MTYEALIGSEHLTSGGVTRRPFWLSVGRHSSAAWLHYSSEESVRPGGVVLCPPLGFEYVHSHRTLLHLADALAARGFATVRLDYPGMGDSTGDETTPGLMQAWLASVEAALDTVEALCGGRATTLVGVRMGALLAGTVASRRRVSNLVAWAPVLRGKRFIRESRALGMVSTATATAAAAPGEEFVEAGGFRFSPETVAALSEADLLRTSFCADEVLVVDRLDQPGASPLVDLLTQQGHSVSTLGQDDYLGMMAEPQYTVVPSTCITRIVGWIDERVQTRRTRIDGARLTSIVRERTNGRRPHSVGCQASTGGETVNHQVLIPVDRAVHLYGVLTQPARSRPGAPLVLLPNSGSVHHVGPNRLYVELAHALASAGFSTLRIDLRNLGDSRVGHPVDENHPYPSTATDDIAGVIRWALRTRMFERFLVAGLCSGAHTALHAGRRLTSAPIDGVVVINPLTFHFEPDMSLDTPASYQSARDARYYHQAMRDPDRWRRFFRGESDVRYIVRFVSRRVVEHVAGLGRRLQRRLRVAPGTRLDGDLLALSSAGRGIHFVFSSTDPGQEILMREAGATVASLARRGRLTVSAIPEADHTFSRKHHRVRALRTIVACLAQQYPELVLTEIDSDPDAQGTFARAWVHLLRRIREPSAFLSWTWMSHWLEHLSAPRTTRRLLWSTSAGDPVGCAIISRRWGKLGPFRVRRSYLNASGAQAVGCEHNDIIALGEYRTEVVAGLTRILQECGADEVALCGVRAHLFEELFDLWPTHYWNGHRSEAPYVDLEAVRRSGGDYLGILSANKRSQIRRSLRLYEGSFGPPTLEIAADRNEAHAWFDEMVALHRKSWRARGERGAFGPAAVHFHRGLFDRVFADNAAEDLAVEIVRVRFGEVTVGCLYNLVCQDAVHFYQSGLRYDEDPRLKPGLVTHALAIEQALRQGYREYDFLGGEPSVMRYKRSLSTDRRHLYWAELAAATRRMTTLQLLRTGRRKLRSRLASLRDGGWSLRAP